MTDRELMQQALDALKVMRPACFAETTLKSADTAIAALRDRLAQPEQTLTCVCGAVWEGELMVHAPRNRLAQPEQGLVIDCPRCGHCCPQPNQEPVAWRWKELVNNDFVSDWVLTRSDPPPYAIESMPLYATPPQRQWVELTDEEVQYIADSEYEEAFVRLVEAKLKEKNT